MSILDELGLFFTKRHAHRDAVHGVEGGSRRQTASLGVNPRDAALETHEYRQAVHDANQSHHVLELEDELRRAEDLRAVVGHSGLYTFGLLGVMAVEAVGAFLILQALGVAPEHRPILAIGLSVTLIAATKAASHAMETKEGETFSWKRLLIPLVYTILVAAIVILRVAGNEDEDTSSLVAFADGALLTALTAGPAWVAAYIEKKRAPAAELGRQITLIRRRLSDARRREKRAQTYLTRLDAQGVAYDRAIARNSATYSVEQDIARAGSTGNAT